MTQHNPDHSVDGLQVPPEVRKPKRPTPPPDDRPWWVCLLKFLLRLVLLRRNKGG